MKKRWPALSLLFVALLSGFGVVWMTKASAESALGETDSIGNGVSQVGDRTDQILLADYLAQMQDLILSHGLREAEEGSDVETTAKTITLNTVRTLSSEQNYVLIEFLDEFSLLRQGMDAVDRTDMSSLPVRVGANPKNLFSRSILLLYDFDCVRPAGLIMKFVYVRIQQSL